MGADCHLGTLLIEDDGEGWVGRHHGGGDDGVLGS